MSCDQNERLIELLDRGPKDATLERHAESCADCAAELRLLREGFEALAPLSVPAPSAAQLEKVRRAVSLPAATLPAPAAALWQVGGLGVAAAAAMLLVIGLQPELSGQFAALTSIPFLVVGFGFGILAAREGKLNAAFLGTSALGIALSMVASPREGTPPEVCATFGAFIGTGPLLLTLLALRDGATTQKVKTGAIAGAASGLLGIAVERLHCPIGHFQHALVGHLTILPAVMALGMLLAVPMLRPAQRRV